MIWVIWVMRTTLVLWGLCRRLDSDLQRQRELAFRSDELEKAVSQDVHSNQCFDAFIGQPTIGDHDASIGEWSRRAVCYER